MPGATRVNVDTAGGLITGPGVPTVRIRGDTAAVVGDAVANHGDSPHDSATLSTGSAKVRIRGEVAVRAGDLATCGHTATGATDVRWG